MSFVGVLACNRGSQNLEHTNRAASDARGGDRCLGSTRMDVCSTEHRLIYGKDDRLDLHCLERAGSGVFGADIIRDQSKYVVAIFKKKDTADLGNGYYALGIHHKPLQEIPGEKGLCKGQTFADQPRGAHCGGVLVDTNTILTAKHCFKEAHDSRFVFNYAMPSDVQLKYITVPSTSVCTLAKDPRPDPVGPDLLLLDIECPPGIPRTSVKISDKMPMEGDVYTIGFPRQLSAKFSGWGPISTPPPGALSFHAALDVSPGNSGGPVFAVSPDDPTKHVLVGILEDDTGDIACDNDDAPPCYIWDTAKPSSKIEIVITSTHDVPEKLARRNPARK